VKKTHLEREHILRKQLTGSKMTQVNIWNFFKTGFQPDFKFLTAPDVVFEVWFIGHLKGDWYKVTVVNPKPLFNTAFNHNFTFLIHERLVPRLGAKRCSALSYNLALRNINCTWNFHFQHQFSSKMTEADDNSMRSNEAHSLHRVTIGEWCGEVPCKTWNSVCPFFTEQTCFLNNHTLNLFCLAI
jgi:hypothetical protein